MAKHSPNEQTNDSQPASQTEEPAFEEALKKLEGIVEEMEKEDLPLEKLLTRFEEGTQLAKACQKKLAEAELKIQQLEQNAGGQTELTPFAAHEQQESPE